MKKKRTNFEILFEELKEIYNKMDTDVKEMIEEHLAYLLGDLEGYTFKYGEED